MTATIRPAGVTVDRQKRSVTIQWSDGRNCAYSFAGLRAICPCVLCQGGHTNMGRPADKLLLEKAQNDSLKLEAANAVGTYAIQFVWSDGHDSGIYTWQYLREACS